MNRNLSSDELEVLESIFDEGDSLTGIHQMYLGVLLDLLFAEQPETPACLWSAGANRCVRFNDSALRFFRLEGTVTLIPANRFFPLDRYAAPGEFAWTLRAGDGQLWSCNVNSRVLVRSQKLVLWRFEPVRTVQQLDLRKQT